MSAPLTYPLGGGNSEIEKCNRDAIIIKEMRHEDLKCKMSVEVRDAAEFKSIVLRSDHFWGE